MYKVIKDNVEYEAYLARIEELEDAKPNTSQGDELELISLLVQNYEETNFPLPNPDPIDVIQFYIEQRGFKNKDLVGIIGDKSIVSLVLNRKRGLTLQMIRNLHHKMQIPYSLLFQE